MWGQANREVYHLFSHQGFGFSTGRIKVIWSDLESGPDLRTETDLDLKWHPDPDLEKAPIQIQFFLDGQI